MSRNGDDSGLASRKLYAVNLPSSSEFIHSVFDAEAIESVQDIGNEHIGVLVVEITFSSAEQAALARNDTDGLQLDDADEQKCIRLYTSEEFSKLQADYASQRARENAPVAANNTQAAVHAAYDEIPSTAEPISPAESPVNGESQVADEKQAPSPQAVDNWQSVDNWKPVTDEPEAPENNWTEAVQEAPANGAIHGEINEDTVAATIMQYIELHRINWAEINELEEMWAICDAVSAANNGLPDSLLKEALLKVIETHISMHMNNWTRQHLQTLLRLWKAEVQSEKSTQRSTKFCAASAHYSPPPPKRRSAKGGRKKALKGLMGVGEVLESARLKFATEEGELDVDEDEYGNYTIGGQELSFEAWGELNKSSEPEIVRANIVIPPQRRKRAKATPSGVVEPSESMQRVNGSAQPKLEKPPKKVIEKDEGELSDESGDGKHDSDSSTSSSASDESDARRRRKKRRHSERKQGATSSVSNMTAMFSKFYQHRFAIANGMNLSQKSAFLELLRGSTK